MMMLSVAFVSFFSTTNIGIREQDIPEISDGIYLDVYDFGIADKITEKGLDAGGEFIPCVLKQRKTLAADMIMTREIYTVDDIQIILYQDVINYKNENTARYAAEILAKDSNMIFEECNVDGYEIVYDSTCSLIAVFDNTVYRIVIADGEEILPSTEELLEIIKEKQQ